MAAKKEQPNKKKEKKDGRNSDGTFANGYRGGPGRPAGSVNTLLRQCRDAAENIALPQIIERAQNGDQFACRTLLQLGLPKMRPVAVAEPFLLPGDNPLEKARALVDAVASGAVSTQTATELAGILATCAKIEEMTTIAAKVDELLERLGKVEGNNEQITA